MVQMQNVIDICRVSTPTSFLTSLPTGPSLPTVIDGDAPKLPGIQNLYFSSGTMPITLASALPKVPGIAGWNDTIPIVSASAFPTGLSLQGISGGGTTLDSISLSVTKTTLTNDLIGSNANTFQSKILSDLVNGVYETHRSENIFLAGVPMPASDSLSVTFTNAPMPTSSIANFWDHPLASNITPDLMANDHIVNLQGIPWPTNFVSGGGAERSWGSTDLLTNMALASTSIAGTDYVSLSNTLSDLTSSGHIVTRWTVTYVTAESQ
jgi:hypothetical protein